MIHAFLHCAARWLSIAALSFVSVLNAQPSPPSQPSAPTQYDVKAVFLFNFTLFVNWPQPADSTGPKPLVIGVLGEDPFGSRLNEVVRDEKLGDRPIEVRRFTQPKEAAAQCDALFIARSEKARLGEILSKLKNLPILTVSDIPDFAEAGGMVELVMVNGKVRLKINVEESNAVHLSISAKLLKPARIVKTRKATRHAPNLSVPQLARLDTLPVVLPDFASGSVVRGARY